MLKLRIEDDEGKEKIVPIIRDEITIGRQEGNTVRLTERNVSRRHARLYRQGEDFWIEEISARYGTLKNGERVSQAVRVSPSDLIRIGDYSLTLQDEEAEARADFSAEPTAVKALSGAPSRRAPEGTEILPAMPAKLVIISSNFPGQTFPLARKQMIIGRGEDCDIIIDHRSVSQRHAKVVREHGTSYQIIDLNSKNGIRIGGEKYNSTYIKRGDVIELGHVKFRFVEAGENYIFTPQAVEDHDPTQFMSYDRSAGRGGLNMALLAGAGVLVLIGVAVIVALALGRGGDEQADVLIEGAERTAAVDTRGDLVAQAAAAPAVPASNNPKIAEGIESSRAQIAEGEVEKAIGTLEGLLNYASPSAEDKETLNELLTEARNERPFQDDYRSARSALESQEHLLALRNLEKLPSHTLFAKLAKEKGMRQDALKGVVATAQSELDRGDRDTAREQLEEALEIEPDYDPASQLLASMQRVAEATPPAPPVRRPAAASTPKSPRPSAKPKEPELSSDEARAMAREASKALFQGKHQEALDKCQRALKAGATDCHRVMGLAYKNLGNTSKACSSFDKALRGKPDNVEALRKQMNELGCAQ